MRSRLVVSLCLLALAASFPLQALVIQGCVDNNKGDVRILKAGQICDSAKEYALSWNAAGISGANGTNGRDGRDGAVGVAGRDGRDGLNCEPAAAAAPKQVGTVTFTDGSVVMGPIPIFEVNGGVENPTTIGSATGGAGAGKVQFNPFRIMKKHDSASATLFHRLSGGIHFSSVLVDLSTSTVTKKYTMEVVFLSNYDLVQPTGSSVEFESITMVYGKLIVDVNGVTKCWNQITNTSC